MGRFLLVCACTVVAGCTPRLAPPYSDFRPTSAAGVPADTLAAALVEAGWPLGETSAPGIISSAPRRIDGASRITAALDLLPLGGGTVRVLVRAERRGLFGGRTKVFSLDPRLRRAILADVTTSLRARGFLPLAEARRRDEDTMRR